MAKKNLSSVTNNSTIGLSGLLNIFSGDVPFKDVAKDTADKAPAEDPKEDEKAEAKPAEEPKKAEKAPEARRHRHIIVTSYGSEEAETAPKAPQPNPEKPEPKPEETPKVSEPAATKASEPQPAAPRPEAEPELSAADKAKAEAEAKVKAAAKAQAEAAAAMKAAEEATKAADKAKAEAKAKARAEAEAQAKAEAEAKAKAEAEAQRRAEAEAKASAEAEAEAKAETASEAYDGEDEIDLDNDEQVSEYLAAATEVFDTLLADARTYKRAALAFNAIQQKFVGHKPTSPDGDQIRKNSAAAGPVGGSAETVGASPVTTGAGDRYPQGGNSCEKKVRLPIPALGYFDLDGRVRSYKEWRDAGKPEDWDEEIVWKFDGVWSNIVVPKDIAKDFYDGVQRDPMVDHDFAKKAQIALQQWMSKKRR